MINFECGLDMQKCARACKLSAGGIPDLVHADVHKTQRAHDHAVDCAAGTCEQP